MARILTLTTLAFVLLGATTRPGLFVAHAATNKGAARSGAAWITKSVPAAGDGAAADAIVALRASGRLTGAQKRVRLAGLRRGARAYSTAPGRAGKAMLGLAAAGANPRCAGGVDLVARIGGGRRGGRYGTTGFDQGFAMLGLRAGGVRVPKAAIIFALKARGGNGWDFGLRDRGDEVSTTALMIMALRAAGVSRRNGGLRAGLRWMRAQRTPAGGFAHERRDRNEANATALAIMAQRTMGSGDSRAARALRGLQRGGGAFQFSANDAGSRVLATNDAVVALSGRALPVARKKARTC